MDVSGILAAQEEKRNAVTVEKDINLELDVGYLTVTDSNPVDEADYKHDLESHLQTTARDGVQALLSALLQLPTQASPDGPLARLPAPLTALPRAKPLPRPRPPTKWEKFAAAKGIQHRRRERRVWDEERQDWVDRWGRAGKNKEKEGAWLSEVKANADANYDPEKEVRDERKARIAKNERQKLQNTARAQGGGPNAPVERGAGRKNEISKTLATTRLSTASMGKFDRKLDGEKKLRGVKRKYDPAERSVADEKTASLALLSKLNGPAKKTRSGDGEAEVLNVRKAVRFASKGRGGAALAREASGRKGAKPR
ncbi:ribosome biogenesis regulatory protein-domain-containing protein, partial [Phellopilus nigrolimitatus]